MNWSDERYVKVYARDTANWKMLPWEAKAVWLLLLRKLDGAGIVDTGSHDRNQVLALILDVPTEVVAKAIPALLADGTLVEVERGLLAPNFIDSQEARKTDTQSKRDQRQKVKDKRSATQRLEVIKAPVLLLSDDVRPCPPSAQLSSAQNKRTRAAEWTDDEKKARASIEAIFLKARGIPLPWTQTMDSAPFRAKLKVYGLERMERYWRFALTTEDKFLRVSTVASLCGKNFARIADAAEGTASTRAPICEVIS